MTPVLALAVSILTAGQQAKEPKAGGDAEPPPAQVIFLGREGYKAEGGRDPLVLQINRDGQVIEKWEVTEKMVENSVRGHCKGHAKAWIVIGIAEPKLTTIHTVEKTIEGLKRYVPKTTVVTFLIQDQD